MGGAYLPYRIDRRESAPFSPRDGDNGDRYHPGERGWDDPRRDRPMDRNRDMMRRDRSRSRERGSPRDRDLRLPKKPGPPPRLDTGNQSGSSTPQPNAVTAPSPLATSISSPTLNASPAVNPKVRRHISEQLPELFGLFCDLVRSKTTMMDREQILAGRRSDLARQQEKTPDSPASQQAIQRGVKSAEREFNKSTKEYRQQNDRLQALLSQLSDPAGDFIANIVRDSVPERRAVAPSPNAPPPTEPKAMQKADLNPLEARLDKLERQQQQDAAKHKEQRHQDAAKINKQQQVAAKLEKQQQVAAAETARELQALQAAMKAVAEKHEELQNKEQAMSRREKAIEDLIEDHRNLVDEHKRLGERCASLESENRKLSSEQSRFERLLETNRKSCEELEKKVDKPRLENTCKKLREDVDKARSELGDIKKEQTQSEDRHQKASTSLRGNVKTLSENHNKVAARVSNVEKRATTIEGSVSKTTDNLRDLKASLDSVPRNTTTPEMSAEVTEKIRQVTDQAIAGLTNDLQSMGDLVTAHQTLLNNFDPDELDKLWWTLPEIKKDTDDLKGQVSALEKGHSELRAEIKKDTDGLKGQEISAVEKGHNEPRADVQDSKPGASREASKGAAAPAPSRTGTPTAATDDSQRISNAIRTAEGAVRTSEEAVKYTQGLKKAQGEIIRTMAGMVDEVQSEVKGLNKSVEATKARLDVLEKIRSDANNPGAQPGEKTGAAPNADKDLADTREKLQSLDKLVRQSFPEFEDRLEGLQQLCRDLDGQQRQLASITGGPPPSGALMPLLRPPVGTGMVRPTNDSREARGPNGSVKRRRVEDSLRHGGTPPATNGAGRH